MRLRCPQTISDRGTYAVVRCCLKHCLMPSGIWWLVFDIYIHTYIAPQMHRQQWELERESAEVGPDGDLERDTHVRT